MGRETRLLLAILGVLGGAFVGVLSMKLLVPRPPAGAGPDVDPQHPLVAGQDIVEPPDLEPAPTASAFAPRRDPFVARSGFAEAEATPDELDPPRATPSTPAAPPAPAEQDTPPGGPIDSEDLEAPAAAEPSRSFAPAAAAPEPPRPAAGPIAGTHVTAAGDTWWSIAERAYGDGRFYRALYAWNRRLDRNVSTAAGTRLEIPPLGKLTAAWPRLVP